MVAIPVYLHDRFQGVVICANRDGGFAELDDDLLLALGDHAGATLHSDRLHHEAGESRRAAVRMLADATQLAIPQLQSSAGQVVAHVRALADRLELDPAEQEVPRVGRHAARRRATSPSPTACCSSPAR